MLYNLATREINVPNKIKPLYDLIIEWINVPTEASDALHDEHIKSFDIAFSSSDWFVGNTGIQTFNSVVGELLSNKSEFLSLDEYSLGRLLSYCIVEERDYCDGWMLRESKNGLIQLILYRFVELYLINNNIIGALNHLNDVKTFDVCLQIARSHYVYTDTELNIDTDTELGDILPVIGKWVHVGLYANKEDHQAYIDAFVQSLYSSKWLHQDYARCSRIFNAYKALEKVENLNGILLDLSEEELASSLIYYTRKDKYCSGYMMGLATTGILQIIIYRFAELHLINENNIDALNKLFNYKTFDECVNAAILGKELGIY